jgi:hypothetical protein
MAKKPISFRNNAAGLRFGNNMTGTLSWVSLKQMAAEGSRAQQRWAKRRLEKIAKSRGLIP